MKRPVGRNSDQEPSRDDDERTLWTFWPSANTDVDATLRAVVNNADTIFTWDYNKGSRPALNKLYEKAKGAQWDGETDLDWSIPVDPEELVRLNGIPNRSRCWSSASTLKGTSFEKWGEAEWLKLEMETADWALSQFMHGEQGPWCARPRSSKPCPGSTPNTTPPPRSWMRPATSRSSPSTSIPRRDGWYPVNPHLQALLDDIINDHRWDMTYLGMQVMVEGLALAAFGNMMNQTHDPLLKQAVALRHERRGPSRGVRGAEPAGVLRRVDSSRAVRASGVRLRRRDPHA